MTDPLDAALLAAWIAAEPELPECHLCGNSRGPWVPDPSGDRWPSGAQKFVCAGGCARVPTEAPVTSERQAVSSARVTEPAPPAPKRRPLSVRVDAQLSDDLAVMARAGMTASDAVRCAVSIVAGAYANAWVAGVVPEGVAPLITDCLISAYDGDGPV